VNGRNSKLNYPTGIVSTGTVTVLQEICRKREKGSNNCHLKREEGGNNHKDT